MSKQMRNTSPCSAMGHVAFYGDNYDEPIPVGECLTCEVIRLRTEVERLTRIIEGKPASLGLIEENQRLTADLDEALGLLERFIPVRQCNEVRAFLAKHGRGSDE